MFLQAPLRWARAGRGLGSVPCISLGLSVPKTDRPLASDLPGPRMVQPYACAGAAAGAFPEAASSRSRCCSLATASISLMRFSGVPGGGGKVCKTFPPNFTPVQEPVPGLQNQPGPLLPGPAAALWPQPASAYCGFPGFLEAGGRFVKPSLPTLRLCRRRRRDFLRTGFFPVPLLLLGHSQHQLAGVFRGSWRRGGRFVKPSLPTLRLYRSRRRSLSRSVFLPLPLLLFGHSQHQLTAVFRDSWRRGEGL